VGSHDSPLYYTAESFSEIRKNLGEFEAKKIETILARLTGSRPPHWSCFMEKKPRRKISWHFPFIGILHNVGLCPLYSDIGGSYNMLSPKSFIMDIGRKNLYVIVSGFYGTSSNCRQMCLKKIHIPGSSR
jgi:hypothetical protein